MSEVLLELEDVAVYFPVKRGVLFERSAGEVRAVDGVSLRLERGSILGLVGESGCGKSTLARAILQLIRPTHGRVLLNGRNLVDQSETQLRSIRTTAQIIFQDPYASLNPRMNVFNAIAEPLLVHGIVPRSDVAAEVAALMAQVGLAPRLMKKYPHEFSGGQRQRIAIARALALRPELIIADEPVSALDVSIQAQIINLIGQLCKERGLTLVFISHDLAVVRHIAERIAVMYLGKIVEHGDAARVFESPLHPYTKALISAAPKPDPALERKRQRELLSGEPPSPMNPPRGCAFHPRCPIAVPECADACPPLEEKLAGRFAACIRA